LVFCLHARCETGIGPKRRLNALKLFPHRQGAGRRRVQMLEDYIRQARARALERGFKIIGEDALDDQILGAIKIRGACYA
jgi:hypothetical protein